MTQKLTNDGIALLAGNLLIGGTSITVEAPRADKFPIANTGTDAVGTAGKDWFKGVLRDDVGEDEIVYVRTRAAGVAVLSNVIRGQEGTTARAFAAGSVFYLTETAADIEGAVNALATSLQKSGGTMTGDLVLAGDANNALEAVPLQQLTAAVEAAADESADALADAITTITNAITAARKEAAPPGLKAHFARTTAPAGWVKSGGGTIGNAASGATARANADTLDLFTVFWNDFSNAALPIQTSAGAASVRGASAAADYAANKRMPIPDSRGDFGRDLDDDAGVNPGQGLGVFVADQVKAHTHAQDTDTVKRGPTALASGGDFGVTQGGTTGSTGGTENLVRNRAWLACFKL